MSNTTEDLEEFIEYVKNYNFKKPYPYQIGVPTPPTPIPENDDRPTGMVPFQEWSLIQGKKQK